MDKRPATSALNATERWISRGIYFSLAREVLQNSLDADSDSSDPVKVKFSEEKIPRTHKFFSGLEEAILACLKMKKSDGTDKWSSEQKSSLKKARMFLGVEQIKCLKIEDFNTTGITDKKWEMLFSGDTNDNSQNSNQPKRGSWGEGHNAALAASGLLSSIYETQLADSTQKITGVVKLTDHIDDEDNFRLNTGYFSDSQTQLGDPILDILSDRTKTGTTLWILGHRDHQNCFKEITSSVLQNYFHALCYNKLEVDINGDIVDNENLDEKFKDQIQILSTQDEKEKLQKSYNYYQALRSGTEIIITEEDSIEGEFPSFGKLKLNIMIGEDCNNRYAFIRGGMLIVDYPITNPNQNCCAVLECISKKGNELLYGMEPACHDKIEPKLLADSNMRKKIKAEFKNLKNYIREKILEDANFPEISSTTFSLPGLSKLFPSSNTQSGDGKNKNSTTDGADETNEDQVGIEEDDDDTSANLGNLIVARLPNGVYTDNVGKIRFVIKIDERSPIEEIVIADLRPYQIYDGGRAIEIENDNIISIKISEINLVNSSLNGETDLPKASHNYTLQQGSKYLCEIEITEQISGQAELRYLVLERRR